MRISEIPAMFWDDEFRRSPPGKMICYPFEFGEIVLNMGHWLAEMTQLQRKELFFRAGITVVLLVFLGVFLIILII